MSAITSKYTIVNKQIKRNQNANIVVRHMFCQISIYESSSLNFRYQSSIYQENLVLDVGYNLIVNNGA